MHNFEQIVRKEGLRVRGIESEYYIIGNGKCYKLNELGALVIKYTGQKMELKDFCAKVSQKYHEEDLDKIEKDVLNYIDFLKEEGLIYINE